MSSRAMASHLGCVVEPAGEFLKSWYPAHTLGQLKVSSCQCFYRPSSTSEAGSCGVGSAPQTRLCQEPPRAWPRNCMHWEWAVPGSTFGRLPGLLSLHIHRPPLRCPPSSPPRGFRERVSTAESSPPRPILRVHVGKGALGNLCAHQGPPGTTNMRYVQGQTLCLGHTQPAEVCYLACTEFLGI